MYLQGDEKYVHRSALMTSPWSSDKQCLKEKGLRVNMINRLQIKSSLKLLGFIFRIFRIVYRVDAEGRLIKATSELKIE